MTFPAEWLQNSDPGQMRRNLDAAYERIAQFEAAQARAAPVLAAAEVWFHAGSQDAQADNALWDAIRAWRTAREE